MSHPAASQNTTQHINQALVFCLLFAFHLLVISFALVVEEALDLQNRPLSKDFLVLLEILPVLLLKLAEGALFLLRPLHPLLPHSQGGKFRTVSK